MVNDNSSTVLNLKRIRKYKNSSHLRKSYDFYPTPRNAIMELLNREKFIGPIWEPACGNLSIVSILEDNGYEVLATDIQTGDDFFDLNYVVSNIITNPPYSCKLKFILHAKELATEKIAMLLPLEFLHGVTKYSLFLDEIFTLISEYVFSRRLTFGTIKSAPFANAWYVWDINHRGDTIVVWVEP